MSEEIKYQGKFLKLTEHTIDNYVWEKIYLPSSLVVFAINEKNEILLIKELRPHEVKPVRLKLVTGHIDPGEEVLECANRELQEEAGIGAKKLEVFHLHESSGTLNSRFYFVLATDLYPSKLPNPDGEHTILEKNFYPLKNVKEMLYQGEVPWTLASIGFFMLDKRFPPMA